jgi:hypothetical protein
MLSGVNLPPSAAIARIRYSIMSPGQSTAIAKQEQKGGNFNGPGPRAQSRTELTVSVQTAAVNTRRRKLDSKTNWYGLNYHSVAQ